MTPIEYAERIAYSSKETLHFTYQKAKELALIDGCYVECGVAAGAQIIAMIHAAPNKEIWAFDSFEGIPLPSNRDDQMPGIRMLSVNEQKKLPAPGEQELISSGATAVSVFDFMNHVTNAVGEHSNLHISLGWFEHTVPKFEGEKIALLRLDGDLYNSTLVCLKELFKKVVKGGCVIIDDWTLPGCRAACDDYFNSINYSPNYQFISTTAYFTV